MWIADYALQKGERWEAGSASGFGARAVIRPSERGPHHCCTADDRLQFGFDALFSLPLAAWQWLSGREPFPVGVRPFMWLVAALIGVIGFARSFLLCNHVINFPESNTAVWRPHRQHVPR
jgi:hypothetical protein